jgi:4-amino-4-deoxy-L-arabinose transferase-like glycosyltransferase
VTRLRALIGRHRILIGVLAAGLVVRVLWLLVAHPDPVSDYWAYRRMGENILDQGFIGIDGPSALILPGHPILLAALMTVSRSVLWLGIAMVTLSTAAALLVHMVALRLTGREPVALVAATVCAFSPGMVLYAPVLATEHLFVVLLLVAILLTLSVGTGSPARAVGAGAVAGLTVLTRGEMVFYLPVLIALIWIGVRGLDPISRAKPVALFVGAAVLVTAPWLIRNAEVIDPGVGLSTVSGMNFWFGHRPDGYGYTEDVPWPRGDDVTAHRVGWELGLEHIREEPISLLESTRDGTFLMLSWPEYALTASTQEALPGRPLKSNPRYVPFENTISRILLASSVLSLSLAAAAFLTWPAWRRRLRVLFGGLLLANWVGHAVLLFGHPRFRYSLDVLLTILVAMTLVDLWQHGRSKGRQTARPAEHARP